jgi:hypothetical protein
MNSNFPIIAIELVLVLGGALAFGWWQFRDLDREAAKRKAIENNNAPEIKPHAAPDSQCEPKI